MLPMAWRVTVVDDRGRRHPLASSDITPGGGDPERAERLRRASLGPREPVSRTEIVRGIRCGLLAIPVLIAAALVPAFVAFKTNLPWWGKILVPIPASVVATLLMIALVRRVAPRRIARDMVRAGYCASCGQDLTGLEPHEDGCTVCPECGAAWRVPAAT